MEQASSTAVIYDSLGIPRDYGKIGPFASRDSCAGVQGVLERLMTHFCLLLLFELMYVCLDPLGLWLGATEGVVRAKDVSAEGAGAMGASGVEELLLLHFVHFLVSI